MKRNGTSNLVAGCVLVLLFVVWTVLIQVVDVQPIGPKGTAVGFASFNHWFHELTGVHMTIYSITDWLGLIPVFVCLIFGGLGFVQLIKRKSLRNVDGDILFLGIYYLVVIVCYLIFETIPINNRPILIDGYLEASYPSSTTLLVLSVMPTVVFQVKRRLKNVVVKKRICVLTSLFSIYMVIGRLISGVHWFTDIVGSVILSAGLFCVYQAVVFLCCKEEN